VSCLLLHWPRTLFHIHHRAIRDDDVMFPNSTQCVVVGIVEWHMLQCFVLFVEKFLCGNIFRTYGADPADGVVIIGPPLGNLSRGCPRIIDSGLLPFSSACRSILAAFRNEFSLRYCLRARSAWRNEFLVQRAGNRKFFEGSVIAGASSRYGFNRRNLPKIKLNAQYLSHK
jgi:hypothetical protein